MDLLGISIDSRMTRDGDLFIALSGDPGPRFGVIENARDGHDFVQAAIAKGAAAVMCRKDFVTDTPQLPVVDTLDGLWKLARAARSRFEGQVVAITGSAGKTTMRGWLEQLLEPLGGVHASVGSYNNHWGVPLSLSRSPRAAEFGVFEVGTNHPGEIEPLSGLVAPDVALLLNVLPAHIGNFADMQALTEEKLAIASGLSEEGTFVLPESLREKVTQRALLTFGLDKAADVSGQLLDDKLVVSFRGQEFYLDVAWKSPERLSSILAAIGVLYALKIDLMGIEHLFKTLELPDGRGNRHEIAGITVIDDSYNANPASMKMALTSLHQRESYGRSFALLGEMQELGSITEVAHSEVANAARGLDKVFTFGAGFEASIIGEHYVSADDFDLVEFAQDLRPGDMVLVKGSNKIFWKKQFVPELLKALKDSY